MAVDTLHPEYEKMRDEWALVKACASGQREVKKLKRAALPAPGEENDKYDEARYKAYLQRAIYTNVTGRTKNGLLGAAFRKEPEVELPASLQYLEEDADGAGQSIVQLAKDVFGCLEETGREGLLVDYPEAGEGLTAEQVRALDLRATIKRYGALDIINWKTSVIAGHLKLVLVVLQESYNRSGDEFDHDNEKQYRVLRFRDDGYTQQVYRNGEPVEDERYPTKSDGTKFEFIPFFIVGSQNNDPSVDDIPLADIAHVNLGHFRNSADLEENSFIHSQLTLGIQTDLDADTWTKMNPNGVVVGARKGHYLGSSGAFHKVQADPNQLTDKLMERKEAQMLALGAKLVEKRNPNETAAAAKIDATGESSVLSDLVTNVEEGIRRAIEWCGLFMGEEAEFTFDMNRDFFDPGVDPAMVVQAMQLFDRAIIAKSDLRAVSRKANLIDEERTDQDIDNEAGQADPLE